MFLNIMPNDVMRNLLCFHRLGFIRLFPLILTTLSLLYITRLLFNTHFPILLYIFLLILLLYTLPNLFLLAFFFLEPTIEDNGTCSSYNLFIFSGEFLNSRNFMSNSIIDNFVDIIITIST